MTNVCQQCKVEFLRESKQKYCSYRCSGLGASKPHIKNCQQCGAKFKSEKHKNRKYCSKECAGLYRRKDLLVKICLMCGNEFKYRSCCPNIKFCSMDCMGMSFRVRKEIECKTCHKVFYPSKNNMKFCSPECSHLSHPRKGYKAISINSLHENEDYLKPMFRNRSSCNEHRIVMARNIGRCLKSTEIVHHKNGVKRDNRIENLELLESKKDHHTGYGDKIYQELEEAKARIRYLEFHISSKKY